MGKIRISRKSHRRKSYVKDVLPGRRVRLKRIRGTRVKGSSYLAKDRGAKGRTPRAGRWFSPKGTLKGWDKDMNIDERRRRAAIGRSDLSSARALLALSNVTTDKKTRMIAREDAKFFFRRHKGR